MKREREREREIRLLYRDGTDRALTLVTLMRDDVTGAISAVWHPGYLAELLETRPTVCLPGMKRSIAVTTAELLFRYAPNMYTGSSVIAVVDSPRDWLVSGGFVMRPRRAFDFAQA